MIKSNFRCFPCITAILFIFSIILISGKPEKASSYNPPLSGKNSITIDKHWLFNYFPEKKSTGYESAGYDDSVWQIIALPHTWSTYETTGDVHPFIKNASEKDDPYWWEGTGWYRKKFIIGKKAAGKKVFIEFDGVMKNSTVYINGKEVGSHDGGFTSFCFDITGFIKLNEENILAVAVRNQRNDSLNTPPMTAGNWNVYGGIYRDVRIVVKDKLHIPYQGSWEHEGGTFVTTPLVSEKEGKANIRTWVKNDYDKARECRLVTVITDPGGSIIEKLEAKSKIGSGEVYEFNLTGKIIADPLLWSPESPNLYHVYTEVWHGKKLADTYVTPLGFRWFRWDYTKNRLILNGQEVHIHGTNRHQEYPWLGDAIPKWIHETDLRDIKFNLNHNFMRTCHYTQDKYVYDWCDRNGIIVAEEVPNIKNHDFSEEIQVRQLKEMIRRDRNHPSILFWSMGNETNDAADSYYAWQEDTTRIIHARHVSGESAGKYVTHTHLNMDMENLLRCTVRGWYNEDVKNLAPVNNQATGHEEHQHKMAMKPGGSQRGIISMGNGVMWVYADHGADREYIDAPLKHLNPKGWVDLYRQPKYIYYLWQANYASDPMVFIHPHFWRQQYTGTARDFIVDSNCDEVELFVNGRSFGKKQPSAGNFHTVTFTDVPVEAGTIKAVGKKNGKTVDHILNMAGEPARIVLTVSHESITPSLNSVVIVKADITDSEGNHIYGANPPLTWKVEGPATLTGPSIWESDIDRNEEMEGTMYIDMPVCNVIRSSGSPGKITVRLSSPGLADGVAEIISAEEKANDKNPLIIEPVPITTGRFLTSPPSSASFGMTNR
jgi:hypothetical protein